MLIHQLCSDRRLRSGRPHTRGTRSAEKVAALIRGIINSPVEATTPDALMPLAA
jgi:hypothetical protein